MTKYEEIIKLLDDNKVDYELIEHKPALTSKESEKVTGWSAHSGAKAIVFKLDDQFLLCIVRGTNTVDFKKLRSHFGVRKARLATPDEVLKVMKVRIGSCYPFPDIAGISGIVDRTFKNSQQITFSPGVPDKHIRMSFKTYMELTQPQFVDIAKN